MLASVMFYTAGLRIVWAQKKGVLAYIRSVLVVSRLFWFNIGFQKENRSCMLEKDTFVNSKQALKAYW